VQVSTSTQQQQKHCAAWHAHDSFIALVAEVVCLMKATVHNVMLSVMSALGLPRLFKASEVIARCVPVVIKLVAFRQTVNAYTMNDALHGGMVSSYND